MVFSMKQTREVSVMVRSWNTPKTDTENSYNTGNNKIDDSRNKTSLRNA